jgi:mannose-6-phosphate isomerase-like protein (cupin superfamily)
MVLAMADYTAKQINDMEAAFGGGFVKVRAELGVTSFGMQIIRMPANYGDYPEHDHAQDGQEEVYIPLAGSGWIDIEGERVDLDKDVLVRIAAGTKRKVHSGPQGLEILVIGGCPGEPYKIAPPSELAAA